MVTDTTTHDVAARYFTAWQAQDFDALAAVLAPGVDFAGPMGTARGVPDCLGGLRGVRGMVDEIHVVRRWAEGDDAITWFELRRSGEEPIPTVNWSHVTDGRIDRIRVTFDPRPLLG